jgi:NAD(P)-dependent dehydrogenase (short-subunit alcohol dehydrogenase family)
MGEEARSVRPMIDKIAAQGIAAQTPEDHAGAYVFLASRENAPAITGQVILSDGGLQARR